ncbi:hypothetical protein CC1G_07800 [Coprinopsis cinerea okayama7|uniref:Uncharacterized protein n=1 Tax=Coprinopsis cinerea (strain Okayama-7 / 130 / ATCC MYA-4618 / FGSC 9003) TaxID=240176 RepID=A8NP36_COPC7|nr:hypothetical protein CC1G_07800 [Coprinopsis cinerea okayama7\|eukprot:XP_001835257.1 hypothetical protein CC1G_07800 [Coprinopsis cinerea okayama7\
MHPLSLASWVVFLIFGTNSFSTHHEVHARQTDKLAASITHAKNITLQGWTAPETDSNGQPSLDNRPTILGIEPISIDGSGATHYVVSQVWTSPSAEPSTHTFTFLADATRRQFFLTQLPATTGGPTKVHDLECINDEDGSISCIRREVEHVSGQPVSTSVLTTQPGRTEPWYTVTNVEEYNLPTPTGERPTTFADSGARSGIIGVGLTILAVVPGIIAGLALL